MIEIKHLKTLKALQHTGSLAAAAASLHLTQSALSHQLNEIEQRLGYRLFIRKSQPLRFTAQGSILLTLANQVIPLVQQALQECRSPVKEGLRLAIECHSCIQWLTPAINTFRQRWPDVELDFKNGVIFNPLPALQQGELDVVMTSDIQPGSHFHYSALFDFEVRLIVAPEHPLAQVQTILPQDLARETMLIYPVQRQRMDAWKLFLQPAEVQPELKSVDNTLLLIQMVAAQMGVAALPHWAVDDAEKRGFIVTKPLGKGLWRRLYAAVRDGEQRQPAISNFIDAVKAHSTLLPFVKPPKPQ